MWNGINQRKFPRLSVECDLEVGEPRQPQPFKTRTQNIGQGGIALFAPKGIAPFTVVRLALYLQDREMTPIECRGKVVWCIQQKQMYAPDGLYDLGIEFMDIKGKDKERIIRFIHQRAEGVCPPEGI